MPSFDVVSEIDKQEATNAVDQAKRQLTTRWDFKGVDASFELNDMAITLLAAEEFQLEQMKQVLEPCLIKRGIKVSCLEYSEPQGSGKQMKTVATMQCGIDKDLGRKVVKLIKESKIKVQPALQGDQVRVTGKARDDLQQVMSLLKESEQIALPLQFKNFKD
ncbi:YajQ family cyclic di-GMP-binding protein [Pelagibaculum spongiae]|uniref:Nucleotide-binding protein DC094_16260 n=1 Tax=Pelagibaculum spongiae TaxID=2080658 RepID=A0A2V1GQL2_9GAMM|nr:YajQ family cyclic di-GMP-binding protein [Pelagibaculum spongiae]PVZ66261.1 YajQ family cyclic di-GMP-binding protein [Pelagibaculum spongiae]